MESWTELIADIIPLDVLVTRIVEEGEFVGFDCLFHIGNVLTEAQTFLGREGECVKRLTTYIEKIHDVYGTAH